MDWAEVIKSPPVCEKDIYNYLVSNPHTRTDNGKMGASRQLKAQTMFKEGHVHAAQFHPVAGDSDHCYVKALVVPSLPVMGVKKSPASSTWVCLSKGATKPPNNLK